MREYLVADSLSSSTASAQREFPEDPLTAYWAFAWSRPSMQFCPFLLLR